MALNIKDPEADALARQLASRTGESLTDTVLNALRERLARTESAGRPSLERELAAIRRRCAKFKVRDRRSADEIIGYDADGVPR